MDMEIVLVWELPLIGIPLLNLIVGDGKQEPLVQSAQTKSQGTALKNNAGTTSGSSFLCGGW
eukprot:8529955-Ditylum_brightwellii.AAC.1